ncbi:hypothetical protein [Streptomyces sp. NPDC001435]|uniref:hypothetical protein n=1 Tax=unclassified Streptomyces TaxID=2593676 RepID=UPI00368E0E4C
MGTAYGLHLMLDLGVPDGRLRTGELVETLWRVRLPDGGWSARSQGSRSRPEVTALVLGALARAGVSGERLASEVARCEAGFTPELDRVGRALTHVVTTVLRGLLRASPGSAAIPVLRDALIAGALGDPDRRHRHCWSHRLSPLPWPSPAARPSPAHTAQAVVALDRVARVLGEGSAARSAREDGIRWLLACPAAAHDGCPDLANVREEVRRPHPDDSGHHKVPNVRHFTAAWVLRALLTLNGAAAAVWPGPTDGIWSGTGGRHHPGRNGGSAPADVDDPSRPFGAAGPCRMDVSAEYLSAQAHREKEVDGTRKGGAWAVGRS